MENTFEKWWNEISPDVSFPEKTPPITEFPIFWKKISPLFCFVEVNDETESSIYFSELLNLVSKWITNKTPPNPEIDFRGFVNFLFEESDYFYPTTIEQMIKQLSEHPELQDSTLLLWSYSDLLSNPFLLLNSLIFLFTKEEELALTFAKSPGFVDQLYDHYLPMAEITFLPEDQLIVKFSIINFMVHLLSHYHLFFNNFRGAIKHIWNKILKIIRRGPPDFTISAFRILIFLTENPFKSF